MTVIKTAELPDNVRLPYVEQGDQSGVPVVMLHGVTDSWHSFELLLPHLPESIHAFALTQRGHGDASRPDSGYRYTDLAADLAAFMDVLRLKSAIVVGHSMGSTVAQWFAIDYPERTAGLVLVGSFASLQGNRAVQELWDTGNSPPDSLWICQHSLKAWAEDKKAVPKAIRWRTSTSIERLSLIASRSKPLIYDSLKSLLLGTRL